MKHYVQVKHKRHRAEQGQTLNKNVLATVLSLLGLSVAFVFQTQHFVLFISFLLDAGLVLLGMVRCVARVNRPT